jgi:lambda repressor-like predicted transcriptional regulator
MDNKFSFRNLKIGGSTAKGTVMHYADIIAALHKAEHPPVKVAETLDVARSTVSMVIHGNTTSFNIASHISTVTGIPLNRLWPDGRYCQARKAGRAA